MPIVVEAVPEDEFDQWLVAQQQLAALEAESSDREWSGAELMERGEKAYQSNCVPAISRTARAFPARFRRWPGIKPCWMTWPGISTAC